MKRDPYSADRAAMHPDRLVILQEGGQPYPVYVQLVLSDLCNQDCGFCAYRSEGYPSNELFTIRDSAGVTTNHNPVRMMPFDKAKEIIQDCAAMGVRAILLTGGGEPTIYPQFGEICELISDYGIDLGVNTNGIMLENSRCYLLPYSKWVRVSIDSGSREDYAAVRNVSPEQFDRVLENIRAFADNPYREAVLGTGFVVTRENYRGLAAGIRLFKEAGADNVRITVNLQTAGSKYYEGLKHVIDHERQRAKEEETDSFKVFDNFDARYGELDDGHPSYSDCGYMHFTTYIGGDQNVYVCCVNAYNRRGCIGSLENQPFRNLWDSAEKRGMFSAFDARECLHCQFNDRNDSIRRLIQGPTEHDNFV